MCVCVCVCVKFEVIYFGGFWDIILGGSGTFSNSMFHSEHFEYHKSWAFATNEIYCETNVPFCRCTTESAKHLEGKWQLVPHC